MDKVMKFAQFIKHYKGYIYFRDCVHIALKDENSLTAIVKELYMPVADKYHTSHQCVERDIRTLCKCAWLRGAGDLVYQVFGVHFSKAPSNKVCIEMAIYYLRQKSN